MKYEVARVLRNGDQVTSKKDGEILIVKSIQIYTALKTVKIHAVDEFNNKFALLNTQVK
jgi:hypothetical protein